MLGEALRFHRHARRVLARGGKDVALGEFAAGYSRNITKHLPLPMVWAPRR